MNLLRPIFQLEGPFLLLLARYRSLAFLHHNWELSHLWIILHSDTSAWGFKAHSEALLLKHDCDDEWLQKTRIVHHFDCA